jgi:hypothetical protein
MLDFALQMVGIEEDNKEDLDISIGSEIGEQEQVEPVPDTTRDLVSLSVIQTNGIDQGELYDNAFI